MIVVCFKYCFIICLEVLRKTIPEIRGGYIEMNEREYEDVRWVELAVLYLRVLLTVLYREMLGIVPRLSWKM
jgi:hypothetical protein